MSRPFLITGHGRSGTKFLATILNESTDYNVIHEVDGDSYFVKKPVINKSIRKRFSQPSYGEVNSYLRYIGLQIESELDVDVLYILRSPIDIALSCSYRREGQSERKIKTYLKDMSKSIYRYIEFVQKNNINRNKIILFDEFTSDYNHIFDLENKINIKITNRDLIISNFGEKINSSKKKANNLSEVYDKESLERIYLAEEIYKKLLG